MSERRYTTCDRLRAIMSERSLRQIDILKLAAPHAETYGVKLTKSDLSQYVSGKVIPGRDKLFILGLALKVSEAWLMGYDVAQERNMSFEEEWNAASVFLSEQFSNRSHDIPSPPGYQPMPEMVSVPLVGRIACGDPITAEENIEGHTSIPAEWHASFTLMCAGASMEPSIHDGDLVAIRSQPTVENGQIAAVRIENEATLKRVYLYEDHIELRPENPAYPSIIRFGENMNDVHIEGKAVGLCRGL